jgi:hypothetical protein
VRGDSLVFVTRGIAFVLAWLCAAVAVLSCAAPCDRLAATSVEIELVDRDTNAPVLDATITYRVDGEPGVEVSEFPDGHYSVGVQEIGTVEVHVEAAGYLPIDREYEVEQGRCEHAATESDRLAMIPAP